MLPGDLSTHVTAAVKNVIYNDMQIKNFNGRLFIDKGNLILDNTSFRIVDGVFNIKASYDVKDPMKANFNLAIKAGSFDVKKRTTKYHCLENWQAQPKKPKG
jgi:hypothetical protein